MPRATTALLAACGAATLGALGAHEGLGRPLDASALVRAGALAPGLLWDLGQSWRLLTAPWVHRDLLHLGANLVLLGGVGVRLERRVGAASLAALALASALGCGLAAAFGPAPVASGASGIVAGFVAAWLVLEGVGVLPGALVLAGLTWAGGDVDAWGHLGGFLAGAAFAVPLRLGSARAAGFLAVAAAVALLAGLSARGTWVERDLGGVRLALPAGGRVLSCGEGCVRFESGAGARGLRVEVTGASRLDATWPAWGAQAWDERLSSAVATASRAHLLLK